MSRFYEALKEASRSGNNAPANPGGAAEWDGSGIGDIDISLPPDLSEPEIPLIINEQPAPDVRIPDESEIAEPAAPPSQPAVDPWAIFAEHELSEFGLIPNAAIGAARTSVALDPAARILPNTIDSAVIEHYRRLRTKLMQQHATKPFQSLVVTSPSPQEGKSVTVFNLALSFAMLPSFKVLVVDGDIRRGSLGKWLGVGDRPGLSNLIEGSAKLEDVVLKCDEIPIHFVVAGTSTAPPGELLQSSQLRTHFRRMGEHFSLVLIDSPPVNLITDAQLLAANCDAVLLVARAFSTTRKSFDKALQDLLPFRVIGTILNGSTRTKMHRRYNGYYRTDS